MGTKNLVVPLPVEVHNQLKSLAALEGKPLASFIKGIITSHLEKTKEPSNGKKA